MSDIYTVITPENVELDYEIAGIGSRFLATGIDLSIQSVLSAGVVYALKLLNIGALNDKIRNYFTSVIGGLIVLIMFLVIFLGYYVILETVLNGQTLGKKIVNIRVRKEGGYAPTFWDILLRNIIRLVDFFPFLYCTGLIVMFFNNRAKRLGDFAAGTIVVKEMPRKQFSKYLQDNPLANPEPNSPEETLPEYPWLGALIPLISRSDYLILKNLISRRANLVNYQALAAEILQKITSQASFTELPANFTNEAGKIIQQLVAQYEKLNFS